MMIEIFGSLDGDGATAVVVTTHALYSGSDYLIVLP